MTEKKENNPQQGTSPIKSPEAPVQEGQQKPFEEQQTAAESSDKSDEPQQKKLNIKPHFLKWFRGWQVKKEVTAGDIFSFITMFATAFAVFMAYSALKETQREFRLSTTNYLQISHFEPTFIPDRPVSFSFRLDNLGKQPTKIIAGTFRFINSPGLTIRDNAGKKHIFADNAVEVINSYCLENQFYEGDATFQKNIDSVSYGYIQRPDFSTNFDGKVRYVNLVTGKEWMYIFSIAISLNKYQMVRNINLPYEEGKNYDDVKDEHDFY